MWWALDKHKVPTKYIGLIKDIYNNVVISVRTNDGDTDDSLIRIGLHQGSALSPYLFALVMDGSQGIHKGTSIETHLTPNMGGDLHIYSQYGWVYKEYNQVYIVGANYS